MIDPQTEEIQDVNSRIEAVLKQIPIDASVLDVGCVQHSAEKESDTNWLHKQIIRYRTTDVLGIDIAEKELAELVLKGYNVEVANAETFDIDREFDCIVAGELIEHLSNPGMFLERAYSHLKPGGKLILTTPNVWGIAYLKRLMFRSEVHCNPEHTCWYDKRTLRQLLERYGFDVRIEYIKPENVTPTPAPQILYTLGFSRLSAISLLAVAEKPEGEQ